MKNAPLILMSIFLIQAFILGCTPPGQNVRSHGGAKQKFAAGHDSDNYTEENVFDDNEAELEPENVSATADDYEYEADDNDNFFQKGMASWYGREFHGKSTASGQKFDMNKLTAAHKTLPFGTLLEVKNLDNGKSVRVTINDRGPYKGNRIIDLSFGAAKRLDMIPRGKVPVGIIVLKKGNGGYSDDMNDKEAGGVEPVTDEITSENEEDRGNIILQVGAFYSRKNAEDLRKKVQELTNHNAKLINDGEMFKVRIEGLQTKREAARFKKVLENDEIPSFLIEK